MKRLTAKSGYAGYEDVCLYPGVTVGEAVCQLADYEDTGMTPEELCKMLKTDKCPQWVSVKKHLPRLDKAVIVATECGSVFEALRMRKDRKQYWTNAVWAYQPIENMTGKVTHWMPMPEPPKKDTDPFFNAANQNRLNKTIEAYEKGEDWRQNWHETEED